MRIPFKALIIGSSLGLATCSPKAPFEKIPESFVPKKVEECLGTSISPTELAKLVLKMQPDHESSIKDLWLINLAEAVDHPEEELPIDQIAIPLKGEGSFCDPQKIVFNMGHNNTAVFNLIEQTVTLYYSRVPVVESFNIAPSI